MNMVLSYLAEDRGVLIPVEGEISARVRHW